MNPNHIDIPELIDRLADQLESLIADRKLNNPLMVGIRTGGVWIAERLHRKLHIQEPLGLLDISFYRDDFSQIGMNPRVKPNQLPTQLEGRDIILVDDVFYTGRTIRAALNEIFDYGRPNQVVLAVLIKRDGKQIPIAPDCVGSRIELNPGQRIKLTGPEPLGVHIECAKGAA
ncbi:MULTISPECIES: bifunctional pyr operon transcriptional regulator/uracil phosphoribosyltransferase PyrR [Methylomicrobium]|uniref:Pyrimidine operon attenuation protein/uracil phosphoribosyltransferase n=1 Tax=Methylomicrobium album BG8 TaxID=686340 RepID=H8GII3_METAL|nr:MULTISPECIES: bifunctional pyr operon transcriptional regulator/uracil phosphoribosyltransferase PyrR [Methylomicrobium]EIC29010.1 pyrimidine operon attenuation protein/uracil phosphoribosyltransferase [Methylomicrobium album BG8]